MMRLTRAAINARCGPSVHTVCSGSKLWQRLGAPGRTCTLQSRRNREQDVLVCVPAIFYFVKRGQKSRTEPVRGHGGKKGETAAWCCQLPSAALARPGLGGGAEQNESSR